MDLINKYWESKRKASKGGPRKSTDASKHKPSRVSSAARETRERSPPPKKRGRSKKEEQEPSENEPEANSDDDGARTKKKPRKSLGGGSSKKVKGQLADDEEEVIVGSMKKHMTIASWENLVDTIDTVERGEGDKLYVYFKMSVKICPTLEFVLMLIEFVEKMAMNECVSFRMSAPRNSLRRCAELVVFRRVADSTCKAYQILRIQSAMEDRG